MLGRLSLVGCKDASRSFEALVYHLWSTCDELLDSGVFDLVTFCNIINFLALRVVGRCMLVFPNDTFMYM
jgi:hypothetical protein